MSSVYTPSAIQQEFHLCTADEAMVGGSGGPGKSLGLLMDPVQTQLVFEHQRWQRGEIPESIGKAIHFRREYRMLTETIDRAHRIFPKIDPGIKWDAESYTFRWSCGYKYQFGHLKDPNDWINYDSNQYDHIGFDELWQFEEEQYMRLTKRCRSTDPYLRARKRVRSATIPSGNWVRKYFVEPAREGRKLLTTTIKMDDGSFEKRTRIFIPALLKDNPDADFRRDYEANLKDSLPHIRKALLLGDWWVVIGAFFAEEFVPNVHVVEKFKIPSGWTRFRSMDWGYKSPCVVLWWAVDTDNNLICYREATFLKKDASEVAKAIREIEDAAGEWDHKLHCSRLSGPADNQIKEQRGTIGPTVLETMTDYGVYWEMATKNRHAAVQQILTRLKGRGEKGVPAIRFFENCKRTVETLPALETDALDIEVPKDGGDDHWFDAVAYACMYRLVTPEVDELPHSRNYYDEMDDMRRKKLNRQRAGGRFGYGSW